VIVVTTKPNVALRAVREGMRLSLDEFAVRVQLAGQRAGEPNNVSKRHVQRWEAGAVTMPQPSYVRALEAATGLPITSLGFPAGSDAMVIDDGRGGHDLAIRSSALIAAPAGARRPIGNHTGIWLSRYEYYSSSRQQFFPAQHYVVLLHHDNMVTVRSIAGSANSLLTMDLSVDGIVVTGSWSESTDPDGYYRGARYHGAIQMQADATGLRMTGKWVGFGKDGETNTGPWTLVFQDADTGKATMEKYGQPPPAPLEVG
jgi:transcriptional regulator with XRE-family HTH domain